MGTLMEKFQDAVEKSKVKGASNEATFDVAYSTGFLSIDMLNGQRIYVDNDELNLHFSYISGGLLDGSSNSFIARAGVGKSTIVLQIASSIVLSFLERGLDCNLYIDDIEKSLNQARREYLLQMTQEQIKNHVKIRTDNITTENVYERISIIANEKLNDKKKYTYDTGKYDPYGNRIFKLIPTVYVIDSLAMLMPEDVLDKDDLGTNATGMATAKVNTMLFKKITQLCTAANIILLNINHILPKPQLGFLPEQSEVDGLKTDERMAGARTTVYISNNIFRLDDKTTLKEDKDYGINGKVVNVTPIKSRTNATRRSLPLIFDKSAGRYDNELSLLHLLKEEGKLEGIGNNVRLESCENVKFSLKNFREVLAESEDLQQAFAKEAFDVLLPYVSNTKVVKADSNYVSTKIKNIFNALGSNLSA